MLVAELTGETITVHSNIPGVMFDSNTTLGQLRPLQSAVTSQELPLTVTPPLVR